MLTQKSFYPNFLNIGKLSRIENYILQLKSTQEHLQPSVQHMKNKPNPFPVIVQENSISYSKIIHICLILSSLNFAHFPYLLHECTKIAVQGSFPMNLYHALIPFMTFSTKKKSSYLVLQ